MSNEKHHEALRGHFAQYRGPVYDTLSEIFVPLGFTTDKIGILDVAKLAVAMGYSPGALYVRIREQTLTPRSARALNALHREITGREIDKEKLTRHFM